MAYKAVFINRGPVIMHAGVYVDPDGRWHRPAGPGGGQFMNKPVDASYSQTKIVNKYGNNFYYKNTASSSSSNSGGSTSSGAGSSASTPKPQSANIPRYTRQDPSTMTNEQLSEANRRAVLESNYNKNYPSTAQQFQEFAGKSNQVVQDGARFVKTFVKEPNYTPLDLSAYSSEELRAHVNRAQLEQQFNNYYNPPKEDHTKEFIDRAAQGLGLAISAAGVAVPIIIAAVQSKKGGK